MYGIGWMALVLLAAAPVPGPSLSASDQRAILRLLCEDEPKKDAEGWFCEIPGPEDSEETFESRIVSARRGRFVAHDDEWLVSTRDTCPWRYCPGGASVLRKAGGAWRRTHEEEVTTSIGAECLQFGGMADGLDRLACLEATGPHQGFLSVRLAVYSFAGGQASVVTLMAKEQGGECFLERAEPGEHQDDDLALVDEAPAAAGTAFTARLVVRRAPCDPETEDFHGPVAVRSEHVLRFVRRGNEIVADPATARVLEAAGWSPGTE